MLIVDTYNVLHTTGVLPPRLAAPGVPGLVRLIGRSRYARRRVTLVCDGGGGKPSGYRMGSVHILYSGVGFEADDVIEDLITRYHKGNTLDVVSSDRRLRRAAGRHGAGSITSAAFLGQLVEDDRIPPKRRGGALRKQVPLDAYSVGQWLREFGYPAAPVSPNTRNGVDAPRAAAAPKEPPPPGAGRNNRTHPALGERIRVDWPPPQETEPTEPTQTGVADEPFVSPAPPAPADPIDPLLFEALEEWRDRLSLDDLDMKQWIPDE